jgi:hypothetical protein
MWEGHHHISGQVRATTATMARDASDNGTTLVAQEEWLMVKMAVAQVANVITVTWFSFGWPWHNPALW